MLRLGRAGGPGYAARRCLAGGRARPVADPRFHAGTAPRHGGGQSGTAPGRHHHYLARPAALDRQGRFWPAFGPAAAPQLSLQAAGVDADIAGLPVAPADDPQRQPGPEPGYLWRQDIPARHRLVAGYSNYYGPPGRLLTGPGRQQVLGLQIQSHYTARFEDGVHVLRMTVELRNASWASTAASASIRAAPTVRSA